MIEADSSISPEGNEHFASCALDEFLYSAKLDKKELQSLREEILKNIYIDIDGFKEKKINVDYLISLAEMLKKR